MFVVQIDCFESDGLCNATSQPQCKFSFNATSDFRQIDLTLGIRFSGEEHVPCTAQVCSGVLSRSSYASTRLIVEAIQGCLKFYSASEKRSVVALEV